MADLERAPYRSGVDIVSMYGPKMDWRGVGYRWHCTTHFRVGDWQNSERQAQRGADDHIAAKHQEPEHDGLRGLQAEGQDG